MKDDKTRLYEIIEDAAIHDRAISLPDDLTLQTTMFARGVFLINDLYWTDEHRNIYQARLDTQVRRIGGMMIPGMYVNGNCTPDGFGSGITTMFRPENRYSTIV